MCAMTIFDSFGDIKREYERGKTMYVLSGNLALEGDEMKL